MRQIIQLASAAVEAPRGPFPEHGDRAISTDAVSVVYTSLDDTLAAVRVAGAFAKALNVPVTLIHFRTVPYALPVDAPCGISPVEASEFLGRLRSEASNVRVRVYLCRDVMQAIPAALGRSSLVVIGGRRRWWPTRSERWRRALETQGHLVVFAGNEREKRCA